MGYGVKQKGIVRRWLINVMLIDFLVILIGEIFIGIFMFGYYRNQVIDNASEYIKDINVLSMVDERGYPEASRQYVQNFKYKNKIEVQLYDNKGVLLITTNGFATPDKMGNATDYAEARAKNGEAYWYGKNSNGERILAVTDILPDLGNGSNGAYRVLVSMEEVIKSYGMSLVLVILAGILALGFSVITGAYFMMSIVKPVREVTSTARKIAGGDMKTRLKIKRRDEIGELCDTINYMASELEHTENVKNDFISSVSHELRTPLTAIKGWGETVRMSLTETSDETVKHGVDVMLGEADRLSGLVEELLDFSRIESGRMTFTTALADPLELIGSIVDMYEEIAKQNKITISYIKPEKCDNIMADCDRIKQVFINIIDNAVKYTEQGGNVVVSVFNEEACIRITISDTGCGIPAKDIDHIKEKFFKANNKVRGSGIGLAVADEIIKYHNGLLLFESTEGEGTTATIVLPTVKAQPDEITEVIYPPEEKGN